LTERIRAGTRGVGYRGPKACEWRGLYVDALAAPATACGCVALGATGAGWRAKRNPGRGWS